ncbi:MAG: Kelch repeat-containing protein [Thermoplasmatota archaeon]
MTTSYTLVAFALLLGSAFPVAMIPAVVSAHTAALDDTIPFAFDGETHGLWDGHTMWIVGASVAGQNGSRILSFDPVRGALSLGPAALPWGSAGAALVNTGSEAILFGGWNGSGFDTRIATVDLSNGSVGIVNGSIPALGYAAAAWDGHDAFLFGGVGGSGLVNSQILRYDPASGVVNRVGTLPFALAHATAVWDGHEILILGGCRAQPGDCQNIGCRLCGDNASHPVVPTILAFNTTTDHVAQIANLPFAVADSEAVWTGHQVIIGGGLQLIDPNANYYVTGAVQSFDPLTLQTSVDSLPLARYDFAAAWTGNMVAFLGGCAAQGTTACILAKQAFAEQPVPMQIEGPSTVAVSSFANYTAYLPNDTGALSPAQASWNLSPGCGTVSALGVVSAFGWAPRTCTLVAATQGWEAQTTFSLVPGPLATLRVEPARKTVNLGETVRFTTIGGDAAGNALPAPPQIAWSAREGRIDAGGNFTPFGLIFPPGIINESVGWVQASAPAPNGNYRGNLSFNLSRFLVPTGRGVEGGVALDASSGRVDASFFLRVHCTYADGVACPGGQAGATFYRTISAFAPDALKWETSAPINATGDARIPIPPGFDTPGNTNVDLVVVDGPNEGTSAYAYSISDSQWLPATPLP